MRVAEVDKRHDSFRRCTFQVSESTHLELLGLVQTYGERVTLVSVEFKQITAHEGRRLLGLEGQAYWFPPRPATSWAPAQTEGEVYVHFGQANTSHGSQFSSPDRYTQTELLNLAIAYVESVYPTAGLIPALTVLESEPSPSEAWCDRCDQPTHRENVLATGETRAYCLTHYGEAMRAQKGS